MTQGRFASGPGGMACHFTPSRICGFRGKDNVEQVLVLLALLQVGAGDLPGGDVVGSGLDIFEGGFRRLPRVGISGRGEDLLQGRLPLPRPARKAGRRQSW